MEMQTRGYSHETHEQFLQRISDILPADASLSWTRLERAIFNHLMAKLIHYYGYANITDAMLQATLNEMQEIVQHLSTQEHVGSTH